MAEEKRLWAFGDSNTECGHLNVYPEYRNIKGEPAPNFLNLLSKRMDLKLVNKGAGGANNQDVLFKMLRYLPKINPGDAIVIGMTHPMRFKIRYNDIGYRMSPNQIGTPEEYMYEAKQWIQFPDGNENMDKLIPKDIFDVLVGVRSSNNNPLTDEMLAILDLARYLDKEHYVAVWSWADHIKHPLFINPPQLEGLDLSMMEYYHARDMLVRNDIKNDERANIDYHLGYKAQEELAEMLYPVLKLRNKTNKEEPPVYQNDDKEWP